MINATSKCQLLVKLKVDIGKNKSEILKIYHKEYIQDKIDQFCKRYQLTSSKNLMILNQVMNQLDSELNQSKYIFIYLYSKSK